MMVRAKIIYILIMKVNKFFPFLVAVFPRRNRKHVLCLAELEKAVETLASGSCSLSISRSPKLPVVFL